MRVFLLFGFAVAAVFAQDVTEKRLTGSSKRVWTAEAFKTAGDECSAGRTLTFSTDHMLEDKRCFNGKIVNNRYPWSLKNQDNDTLLEFSGGAYSVLFKEEGKQDKMRLRMRQDSKGPSVEQEFSSPKPKGNG